VGITADTPTNLVIGAGEILRDHANVGATTEDNAFRIEREIFTPDLNGTKGALKGTDYITSSMGVLEASIPEFNATIILSALPGFQTTGAGAMEVIDEDETRRIPDADYVDWELQVERLNGGEFQFEVDDAIATSNFEAELGDDSLAAPRLTLQSRWDPAAMTASPHRIRILATAS
jgi:hypothetical protein